MKEKYVVEGKKAAWTLTCKYINDFLVMILLYWVLIWAVGFAMKLIGTGSNFIAELVAAVFAIIAPFEFILAGMMTMKWTKKKLNFSNSKKATLGITIFTIIALVSRILSVVSDIIINANYILNISIIAFDIIFAIVTIKYCSYNVKQLEVPEPAGDSKIKGTVSYKIVGVIGIILIVAGLVMNVIRVPLSVLYVIDQKEQEEMRELLDKANAAKNELDRQNAISTLSLEYAQALNRGAMAGQMGIAVNEQGQVMTKEDYLKVLGDQASLVDFDVNASGAFVMKK